MIELILLNYLEKALSVPVCMEMPKDISGEFVLIEKTGSSVENKINNAVFAIQSYSTSLYGAALLNSEVIKAMVGDGVGSYGIIELDDIGKCSLNSDYNFPDLTNKKHRYQAVFDLVY